MANLDTIIDLTIDRKTGSVSRASFGLPMHVGYTQRSAVKAQKFDDLDGVGTVFLTTDPEYIAASDYFAQSPKPKGLVIALRDSTVVITVSAVENSSAYTVKINGTSFTYNSDPTATEAEITAGLTSAINGGSEPVTATDNTTSVGLANDTAGDTFDLELVTTNLAEAHTAVETLSDFLPRARAYNDAWYFCSIHSRVKADITAFAALIEPLRRLYGWQSSDADLLTNTAGNVGVTLKDLSYARSFGTYHAVDAEYAELALIGQIVTRDPGGVTAVFKTLASVAVDVLTATEQTNLDANNVSYYVTVGGVNITQGGKVAVGEFIDVMRDVDWLHVNMQADVFELFVNEAKVPYTDPGVAQVESKIRARLQNAIAAGVLADDGSVFVTVPAVADILTADKASRTLPDLVFGGNLAGAIHFVKINGTVAV